MNGTVTDSSGSVVAGAEVIAKDVATQSASTTQSKGDGTFVINGLVPGIYTLTVSKKGFKSFTESQIELHPAIVATINATLNVGDVGTEISVIASSTEVQTTTSEVSGQVSGAQTSELPLNGRNFQSLSALMPGVVNSKAGSALGTGGYTTNNTMVVGGLPTNTTFYALDGVWNENTGSMGSTAITPNPDTLQEVRVLQDNYEPKFSLLGASVVLLQTKSGTTSFHGTVFEYFRNTDLNARNFFSPTVPQLNQNIWGYTLGGPVLVPFHHGAKKTFFFASSQWVDSHAGSVNKGATPTADQRNGIFTTAIKDPTTGQPFPQTSPGVYQIPASRLNPNSLAFFNALYPLPNNVANGFQNYINLTPTVLTQRDDQFNVEHSFNERLAIRN